MANLVDQLRTIVESNLAWDDMSRQDQELVRKLAALDNFATKNLADALLATGCSPIEMTGILNLRFKVPTIPTVRNTGDWRRPGLQANVSVSAEDIQKSINQPLEQNWRNAMEEARDKALEDYYEREIVRREIVERMNRPSPIVQNGLKSLDTIKGPSLLMALSSILTLYGINQQTISRILTLIRTEIFNEPSTADQPAATSRRRIEFEPDSSDESSILLAAARDDPRNPGTAFTAPQFSVTEDRG